MPPEFGEIWSETPHGLSRVDGNGGEAFAAPGLFSRDSTRRIFEALDFLYQDGEPTHQDYRYNQRCKLNDLIHVTLYSGNLASLKQIREAYKAWRLSPNADEEFPDD